MNQVNNLPMTSQEMNKTSCYEICSMKFIEIDTFLSSIIQHEDLNPSIMEKFLHFFSLHHDKDETTSISSYLPITTSQLHVLDVNSSSFMNKDERVGGGEEVSLSFISERGNEEERERLDIMDNRTSLQISNVMEAHHERKLLFDNSAWMSVTSAASWSIRYRFGVVVYNSNIIVMGGGGVSKCSIYICIHIYMDIFYVNDVIISKVSSITLFITFFLFYI